MWEVKYRKILPLTISKDRAATNHILLGASYHFENEFYPWLKSSTYNWGHSLLTKLDEPPSIRWDFPNAMNQPWLGVILHYPNTYLLQGLLPPAANPWKELETKTEKKIPDFCQRNVANKLFRDDMMTLEQTEQRIKSENALCTSFVRTKKAREVKRSQEVFHFLNRLALRPPKRTPRYTETPPSCIFPWGRQAAAFPVQRHFLQPLKKYPKPLSCLTWV